MTIKSSTYRWIGGALALFALIILIYELYKRTQGIQIIDKYNSLMRNGSYSTRSLDKISQIVVHHSASTSHKAEDFARWHVEQRGWAGIGYHFVIEKDGTIIRGNPLENISYNVANHNTKSIGICLSGNFEVEEPTDQQLKYLRKLIIHLRKLLPQPLQVYRHRDFGSTSCPGGSLYTLINDL